MKKIVLIKLGGSAITYKDTEKSPNLKVINRCMKELAELKNVHPIIVHGAGSFGHPIAKKYDLINGLSEERHQDQIVAVARTRQHMLELHKLVVDAAIENGLHPYSLPASAISYETSEGKYNFFGENLTRTLRLNLNPILYGDIVMSDLRHFTILSGDTIMYLILEWLKGTKYFPSLIVFGSDVDGLYTDDPKINERARLIETVSIKDVDAAKNNAKHSMHDDITAGMLGKISAIEKILKFGIEAKIVNLLQPGRISSLLSPEFIGTNFQP